MASTFLRSSVRVRPALIGATLLALAGLSAPASAQEPDPLPGEGSSDAAKLERSRKLFDEGRALAEQNRWADACPLFEAAHATNATGGTALQLARCYEMIDLGARAIPFYQYILDNRATQPEARVAIAETRIAALKAEVEKAPAEAGDEPEPAPPKVPPPASEAGPTAGPATPPPSAPSRAPAFVALGVGGAGLVVGGIFGALALSKAGEANELALELCPGSVCPAGTAMAQVDDARGSATTMAWVSNVGLAVGIVGVAVGVVLLATQKSPEQTGLSLPVGKGRALRLAPTASGLRASF